MLGIKTLKNLLFERNLNFFEFHPQPTILHMNKKWISTGILVLCLGAGYYLYNQVYSDTIPEETELEVYEEEEEDLVLFGINAKDLDVIEGVVGKNETLSSLLAPFNIPFQIIDEIAKKSKEVFDVRRIAYNKKFTVLAAKDSSQAQFFIYEPNPLEYVVINLEAVEIYKEEKPVSYRPVEIGGEITSNLSSNMTALGISYDVVDQFADLFGWSIDFGALQKGDEFKVVFQEKVVEDAVVGNGEIEVAYFKHKGQELFAIPFEQNGQVSFFDQEGSSFKKAFLRDPLKYTRISSRYNLNRFHPVQKRYKPHLGTDYAAPTGTEIRTVGDGTVVEARFTSANGNYVKIKHNETYTTQYLHMSKFASGIKPGMRVKQGQVIGYVGSTGLATGPHLCFRFWKNGKQVDWLQEKIPPSEPIAPANRAAFELVKAEKLGVLAAIPIQGEQKLLADN